MIETQDLIQRVWRALLYHKSMLEFSPSLEVQNGNSH
jgi:hypothetical protein